MAKYLYSYLLKSEQMKLKKHFLFSKSQFLIQKKKNQIVFQLIHLK